MNKDFNVLMVTGDYPPMPRGVGDYSYHLSKALCQMGLSVSVITTRTELSADLRQDIDHGLDVQRIISEWTLKEADKIIGRAKSQGQSAVVNIQYYCPDTYGRRLMINLLPLLLRARIPKTRVVVTIHGFWEQSFLYRVRTLPMLRATQGVIYVDRQNHKFLSRYSGLQNNRLHFIPISTNILPVACTPALRQEWRQRMEIKPADKVVGFFGAIGQPKGFIYLIESIKLLREQHEIPLILLAIGGFHSYGEKDEYQAKIKRVIEDPIVKPWVKVIQEPTPQECSQYLHCCDMATFPFLKGVSENSGSTLAALFHELPVVVTEGPPDSKRFYGELEVPVVPSEKVTALAEAIFNVLSSREKRETMRQKARELKNRLGWDNIARQTAAFYESLFD